MTAQRDTTPLSQRVDGVVTGTSAGGIEALSVLLPGGARGDAGLGLHRAGGLTIAQQPQTAHASLMVESALKRTPVDFVLTLDQIADFLRKLGGDGT